MQHTFFRQLKRFIPLIAIGFLLLAVLLAHRQFTGYSIGHLRDLIFSFSPQLLAQAFGFTAAGYLITTCYDRLALRYIHKKLSLGKTMLVAFISFAISHNAGHPLVTGTSLRYRFYPNWGLKGIDVIKITLVDSVTYGLGLSSVLLIAYGVAQWVTHQPMPMDGMQLLAGLLALAYAGYWFCVLWWRPVVTVKGVRFELPRARLTLAQMLIGASDVFFAGMVLYTLLSSMITIPLSEFFIIYILSLMIGNLSQLPGGLAVFEGMFLHLLSAHYPDADILAPLVLYRIIYYFVPLGLAGALLLGYELKGRRHSLRWPICKKFSLR